MKKYAIIFLFLFASCVTQKKCLQKFPPTETVKIEYRDTIIPVYVPRSDTVYQFATIRDTVRINTGTSHAVSYVIKDTLKLILWQTDTTLKVKLDSALKVISTQKTNIVREKYTPEWVKTLAGVGGIVLLIFFIWFGLAVKKFFFK